MMGTQIDDFAISGFDDLFGSSGFGNLTDNPAPGEDVEVKMIQDGNAQVLRNFETRKKNRDYARSQTSRSKKKPDLNMNQVDWSGFPGAAHKASPAERNQKRATRRSSLEHDGPGVAPGDLEEHKNNLHQAQRRLGASAHGSSLVPSKDHSIPPAPSSPQISPNGRRYRNRHRRHLSKTSGMPGTPEWGDADDPEQPPKRKTIIAGARTRAERRDSGSHSHRVTRQPSARSIGRSNSRSMSRSRRSQAAAQRQSLSPTTGRPHHSTSPTGRVRRPIAAAASSTTLEVGKNTGRRKTRQRSNSYSRRKTNQKSATDVDEQLFQKTSSFRW